MKKKTKGLSDYHFPEGFLAFKTDALKSLAQDKVMENWKFKLYRQARSVRAFVSLYVLL